MELLPLKQGKIRKTLIWLLLATFILSTALPWPVLSAQDLRQLDGRGRQQVEELAKVMAELNVIASLKEGESEKVKKNHDLTIIEDLLTKEAALRWEICNLLLAEGKGNQKGKKGNLEQLENEAQNTRDTLVLRATEFDLMGPLAEARNEVTAEFIELITEALNSSPSWKQFEKLVVEASKKIPPGKEKNLQAIRISAEDCSVAVFDTITPNVQVAPANALLAYISDNPSIATVDSTTGVITGVGPGTANITVNATRSGFLSASTQFMVTVYADIADSTISPTTATFDKNTEHQRDIVVELFLNGNTLEAITNGQETLLADTDYLVDEHFITITKEYLLHQAIGDLYLVFEFSAGANAHLRIGIIDTTIVIPPSISLSSEDVSVAVGTSVNSPVTVQPEDAVLTYSSTDASIASVNDQTGLITGISPGATVITVLASKTGYADNSISFTVTVTPEEIKEPLLKELTLAPGALYPQFNPEVTAYWVEVDSNVTHINLTPVLGNPEAQVTINGLPAQSGQPQSINLELGSNLITLLVTWGEEAQDYLITVTKTQELGLDHWYSRGAGVTDNLNKVAYGNGIFVAVGDNGVILTSPDGVSWNKGSSGTPWQLDGIAYGNGTFVAVGDAHTILVSNDNGRTWSDKTFPGLASLWDITFTDGTFIAVGNGGTVLRSVDNGQSWSRPLTPPNTGSLPYYLYGIASSGEALVAVGRNNLNKAVSFISYDNGANWQVYDTSQSYGLLSVAYGNNTFLATGIYTDNTVTMSDTGEAWHNDQSLPASFPGITYGNGTFIVAGWDYNEGDAAQRLGSIKSSPDGLSWQNRLGNLDIQLFAVGYGNGTFIAVGEQGTILQSAPLFNQPNTAPIATNVSITGTARVGEALTGSYTYTDGDNDQEGLTTMRWLVSDTAVGPYRAIPGETGTTLPLTADLAQKFIKFQVTPVALAGASPGQPSQSGAIGPVVPAGPAPIPIEGLNATHPALAYDPPTNRYLSVYLASGGTLTEIYGQLIQPDGSPAGPVFVISNAPSNKGRPSIAYGNGKFLVVWEDQRIEGEYGKIYGQLVNANGTLDGTEADLNFMIAQCSRFLLLPTLAFDSVNNRFLVVWQDEVGGSYQGDIFGQLVSSDGSLLASRVHIINEYWTQSGPQLIFKPLTGQYFLMFQDSMRYSGQALSSAGTPVGPYLNLGGSNINHRMAYNPEANSLLLAFDNYADVLGRLVNLSTSPASFGSNINISNVGEVQDHPTVAYATSEGRYLVVWQDSRTKKTYNNGWPINQDLYGQLLNADGSLIGSDFLVTLATNNHKRPVAVYNPTAKNFLITYENHDLTPTKIGYRTIGLEGLTDMETVNTALDFITFDTIKGNNTAPNNIKTNLNLPTGGPNGTTISWQSSSPQYISTTGEVTRPTSEPDQPVTLTASITKGSYTAPKVFNLIVKAPAIPVYFNDFEAEASFTPGGTRSSWQWGSPSRGPDQAKSGQKVWATNLGGDYNSNENSHITSPLIDLSSYSSQDLILSWWQYLKTESSYDFARVEVSKDGGGSWTRAYGPVSGNISLTWTQEEIILDPSYAVSNFRVRFGLQSDGSVQDFGWYIDDFCISR